MQGGYLAQSLPRNQLIRIESYSRFTPQNYSLRVRAGRRMDPIEEWRSRVVITISVSAVLVIFQVLDPVYPAGNNPNGKFSITLLFFLFESVPGVITLVAIAGATLIAGPLGLLGAILEVIGTNQLMDPGESGGLFLLLFGAALVVAGSFFLG